MAGELQVEIAPWGPRPEAAEAAVQAALERPAVRAELGGGPARLLSVQPLDGDEDSDGAGMVRATLYDYEGKRALLLDVPVEGCGG